MLRCNLVVIVAASSCGRVTRPTDIVSFSARALLPPLYIPSARIFSRLPYRRRTTFTLMAKSVTRAVCSLPPAAHKAVCTTSASLYLLHSHQEVTQDDEEEEEEEETLFTRISFNETTSMSSKHAPCAGFSSPLGLGVVFRWELHRARVISIVGTRSPSSVPASLPQPDVEHAVASVLPFRPSNIVVRRHAFD